MNIRDILSTLVKAVDHTANKEILTAAHKWLDEPSNGKPIRIVVDITGGLFEAAYATVPVEVLAIDSDDTEHPRASIPGFGNRIWASFDGANVAPDLVNTAFDKCEWLPDEEDT